MEKEVIQIEANRQIRRNTTIESNEDSKYEYVFVPCKSTVIANHKDWTFLKMKTEFGFTITDKPKYQRPDVDGSALMAGDGNVWQKSLLQDVILGNPFQPIHLRFTESGIIEIVDGGHRTRAIIKFLNGYITLPADTILKANNGDIFDLSGLSYLQIIRKFPFLKNYIENLTFEVYEYRNISNKQAETLFLKLNDLHTMSHADKRNAIDNIIADVCRDRGAIDSPNGLHIFTTFTTKGTDKTLQYVSVPITARNTDEMISFFLYYLYKGGINGKEFYGLEDQGELNDMYRDVELIKRISNPTDTLLSDLDSLLDIIDKVVREGRFSDKRAGSWGKGALKKLCMIICESAWESGGFSKYKPNIKNLFNDIKTAYEELSKAKIQPHHPHQLYEIDSTNKVVPLPKSKQLKKVKYHETHQFISVWTGGARIDDLQYIYLNMKTKGVTTFGLGKKKDDVRTFTEKQKNEFRVEQEGCCKKCGVDLDSIGESGIGDHILPHAQGGPTEVNNGQLLCNSCNEMKSSGMDKDDVIYLCEKNNYDDVDGLLKYIIKNRTTLTESQIKEVAEAIFQ